MATFFRTQDHVPDVYSRKSRDFQLFCSIFDCLNDGIKYDIDSMLDIVDTNQCNERLIPYLQTKLGFWSKEKISADRVRHRKRKSRSGGIKMLEVNNIKGIRQCCS